MSAYLTLIAADAHCRLSRVWVRTPWQPFLIATYVSFIAMVFEGVWGDTDHWRHFYILTGLRLGTGGGGQKKAVWGSWHGGAFRRQAQLVKSGRAIKIAAETWKNRRDSRNCPKSPRSSSFSAPRMTMAARRSWRSNLAAAMRKHGHHVEEWYLFGSDGDMPQARGYSSRTKRSHSPLLLTALFCRVVAALRQRKPDVLFGLQP